MTPEQIIAELKQIAPDISIETHWEHDHDLHDIRKDCEGMDDENPNDWQAWQSEVRATAIQDGEEVTASEYLGGTWEKSSDSPWKSNPDISGYFPQMAEEALTELAGQLFRARLREQCERGAAFLKSELAARYSSQLTAAN